ncbi:GAF domain-containing protein [Antrihabitans stalactiti]|uniref:GAF domain-containing protein n=1 Tax=Antrihabitans stalactiti TaxID=2584121 RepID=A0A848KSB8_9NOCA|nr:GAF domain-containing protein [Antrihabitans stalactiti]NMN99422.1 GAF domain-containing protein [Antrihabitans stalactiti]
MRSRRDDVDADETIERAMRLSVCGFGGRLDPAPATLEEAISATSEQYDERTARRLERFAQVPDGSFVWSKLDGRYFLGRITGEWRYDDSSAAARVDLVHIRPCVWSAQSYSEATTPRAVAATFARGGRNFQEIHSADVVELTCRLWSEPPS